MFTCTLLPWIKLLMLTGVRTQVPPTSTLPLEAKPSSRPKKAQVSGDERTRPVRLPTAPEAKGAYGSHPTEDTHTGSLRTEPSGSCSPRRRPGARAWRPRLLPMLPYAPPTPARCDCASEQGLLTGPQCGLCHLPVPATENEREGVNSFAPHAIIMTTLAPLRQG